MFAADYSNQSQDQQNQSYQSDQGPHRSSIMSVTSAIKQKDIMNCMQVLQQQLKSEDIQQIQTRENSFLKQFDTFSNTKQLYLNNLSTQNQYTESNMQSTGQFNKDNKIQSTNPQFYSFESQSNIPPSTQNNPNTNGINPNNNGINPNSNAIIKNNNGNNQKSSLILKDQDMPQNDNNYSLENNAQQNENTQEQWEEQEDDEEIMMRLQNIVEQFKSMSQMENNGSGQDEEVDGEIQDDDDDYNSYDDDMTRNFKRMSNVSREEIFQEFFKRNESFLQKKQKNLYLKRAQKTMEESSYQKKGVMSKKSKQICQEIGDQFSKSIGDRSKEIQQKKQKEILSHQAALKYQQTMDCTFKPLLNANSLNRFNGHYRTADEFYEDVVNKMKEREHNLTYIQMQSNLEREQKEQQEEKEMLERQQIGLQLDPNSMRICERRAQNGQPRDFLDRLEQDIDQRVMNKMHLEMNHQPTFQPLIYENIRSPAIINNMQNLKASYRMQKVNQETSTWNQFTSPVSNKSRKINMMTMQSNKEKERSMNKTISDSSKKSMNEQESTPLSDKHNTYAIQHSQKQQNKNSEKLRTQQSANKITNHSNHQSLNEQQNNSQFTSINDSKNNNKYNSASTKFTSIKSNQKYSSSSRKPFDQSHQIQDFSNSPFNSNITANQQNQDSINIDNNDYNQTNQMNYSELQANENNTEVCREQFSSFIQQNINKLKSTLNKMP